ncbi:hypothetical protein VB715_06845 [Crocosphaera sp. UHCC 0190]|uniref:hypothetical protein n=1 Tax=Crocosphaera sp. UHCC 0190 TaxID=3110246 RepID=UPI002B218DF4|nr:hypothetical protein [Crocosphaera sp. UHCC 0190]MEA5509477.1 hypothetical protein [Crocosphaera sp. UHCC 0190]
MSIREKWAVTLCYKQTEKLEDRIAVIIQYLDKIYPNDQWNILDIDATGKMGNQLTQCINNEETLLLSSAELLQILTEEGQVIDLEISLINQGQEIIKIFVEDGVSIDVLGVAILLPTEIFGEYKIVDSHQFLWQETSRDPIYN